ncbi:MAG: hypothetical protein KAI43_05240 [Candidatus Aureabacteria bacterium]|nr:hypothetical protein [Candidatus Auribacterota bacterium]
MVNIKLESNTKDIEKKIEGISLGVFFICIGICWAFAFPEFILVIGISLIMFGSQVARAVVGSKIQKFWIFIGLIFLLSGLAQFIETKIKIVPIFFIAIGAMMLYKHIRSVKDKK